MAGRRPAVTRTTPLDTLTLLEASMPTQDPTTSVEYRTLARFVGYRFGSDGSAWTQRCRGRKKGQVGPALGEWKLLKPIFHHQTGYFMVMMTGLDKKQSNCYLHRLILEAFHGPCPEGMGCRHLNGIRTDNRLENLAWGTWKENSHDRYRHGTVPMGKDHWNGKVDESDKQEIREARTKGVPTKQLAEQYGISQARISSIAPTRRNPVRLSEEDKRKIRQARLDGVSCLELATQYGITPKYLSYIAPVRRDARPRTKEDRGCIIN